MIETKYREVNIIGFIKYKCQKMKFNEIQEKKQNFKTELMIDLHEASVICVNRDSSEESLNWMNWITIMEKIETY
ncbi:22015_t:CDS:2 [Rhizophagus irregularis]|nr:22015_t:CDS:2 [Rhizophagus irregularis]